MFFSKEGRRRCLLLALTMLPLPVAFGQEGGPVADTVAPPITVRPSSGPANAESAKFLSAFIIKAGRLDGEKLCPFLSKTVKERPDLAAQLVVCALDLSRLRSHLPSGRPCAKIGQIVKCAVAAAPEKAADIVKAAIESEPSARSCVIAAAIAAAPDQVTQILAAADQIYWVSTVAWANTTGFNPVNDGGGDGVNSPEQPPGGP